MSLYEQYYSDINKTHMVSLINKIMIEEMSIDLNVTTSQFMDTFSKFHEDTFQEIDTDDLKILNKTLLDKHITYYGKQKTQEKQQVIPQKQNSQGLFTVYEDNKPELSYVPLIISSSLRKSVSSSRYHYKIDIDSESVHHLSKIIIPIEDNYLFSQPQLSVSIPEFSYNVMLFKETEIINKHRTFGVYKSNTNQEIQCNKETSRTITIDIRDADNNKYVDKDIIHVNIVEINSEVNDSFSRVMFTCSNIQKGDYLANDYIKIINNNTKELQGIFKYPLKINKIKGNIIHCKINQYYENKIYNNADMKVINMSNQNTIQFN